MDSHSWFLEDEDANGNILSLQFAIKTNAKVANHVPNQVANH